MGLKHGIVGDTEQRNIEKRLLNSLGKPQNLAPRSDWLLVVCFELEGFNQLRPDTSQSWPSMIRDPAATYHCVILHNPWAWTGSFLGLWGSDFGQAGEIRTC